MKKINEEFVESEDFLKNREEYMKNIEYKNSYETLKNTNIDIFQKTLRESGISDEEIKKIIEDIYNLK